MKNLKLGQRMGPLLCACFTLFSLSCRGVPSHESTPEIGPLIDALSESGGYFDTDNLISNETSYVQVVDRLEPTGGVYIGVGPQQNFTYIGRMRPSWAFILDIRRDNMLQHLLFNAVLSKAETPYQYLCWLFSRPIRTEREPLRGTSIRDVVSLFEKSTPSREVFNSNLRSLLGYIETELRVDLTPGDRESIRAIYTSFYSEQLEIRFNSHARPPMPYHPTYRRLLLARSASGREGHFLASSEDYAYVRKLAVSGRLVPVVGDFAGPHALRAIGALLKDQKESVSAFYVSNVEFYLIRAGRFAAYVDNVESLPLRADAVFIRAYFNYGLSHPERISGHRSTLVLQHVPRFLSLYASGAYRSYWDVCTVDYLDLAE